MRLARVLATLPSLALVLVAGPLLARADEPPNAAARRRFEDAKLGLFVHWGVYALLDKGESVMEHDRLPASEYEKLPPRFNPTGFDADALIRTAKAAGARYVTFTAKHHDGFCMFETKYTRFDIVDATPYARDPLKALADACRKHGLLLFAYYSLLDWHHPDYGSGRAGNGNWRRYLAYCRAQVRELCTRYGPIGGVWLDGAWDRPDADWELDATYRMIHMLQPAALVGNNHHQRPRPGEDFRIFDQDLAGIGAAAVEPALPLETCLTVNGSWGCHASDKAWKAPAQLIRALVEASGRGSNLLVSVALRPDGTLGAEPAERLRALGGWLKAHGESIYETRVGPVPPRPWGVSTARVGDGNPRAFLHVLEPGAPVDVPTSFVALAPRLLGRAEPLGMTQAHGRLVIELPARDRSAVDTVIVLSPKVLPR